MIDRICISINNHCNLRCSYCHFSEKKEKIKEEHMDVISILDNVIQYIKLRNISVFTIGFVGNGEPLLEYEKLKEYIEYIKEYLENGRIKAYIITNGLLLDKEKVLFFKKYGVDIGFSIDGIPEIHNKYRCNTYKSVIQKIELYKEIHGIYPSMNCTVGEEILKYTKETIDFFAQFHNRITFSRMIGKYGISLESYREFLKKAKEQLNVRTGGYDCTMYGGMCGAGMNNFFFANGNVFICGNCIDKSPLGLSSIDFKDLENLNYIFDRNKCYKEEVCE